VHRYDEEKIDADHFWDLAHIQQAILNNHFIKFSASFIVAIKLFWLIFGQNDCFVGETVEWGST